MGLARPSDVSDAGPAPPGGCTDPDWRGRGDSVFMARFMCWHESEWEDPSGESGLHRSTHRNDRVGCGLFLSEGFRVDHNA